MKKLVIFLSAVMISSAAVNTSKTVEKYNGDTAAVNDVVISGCPIVVVSQYSNYAWEPTNRGTFIDSEGYIYEFDLSKEGYEADLMSELYNIHQTKKGRYFGNTAELAQIRALADGVSPDAEIKQEYQACDAGQKTLYAVTTDAELVEIRSSGDCAEENTDTNAKKIDKICQGMGISVKMW